MRVARTLHWLHILATDTLTWLGCHPKRGTEAFESLALLQQFNLETAVERARVGCHGVFWQGATTLRATARKEKQRRQSAPGRLNRVGSVVTQKVNSFVSTEVSVHAALQAEVSGQLRFLG